MIDTPKYFPEGLALGEAFINRSEERNLLINRIKSVKHTVLMAPRRYGETSLVTKVAQEMGLPYCALDLLAAYSEEYVRDQIIDKVSHLVFQLLPAAAKAKEKLIHIFRHMKPEISLGAFGQRLSLHLSESPLQDITEVLLKLDETAKNFNKRAVIFMDEFQQISQLKNHPSIEASIRHAVERSEQIAYVFSGSNRQLLQQMFGQQSRPLYRLCHIFSIERMERAIYIKHLQHLANLHWKKPLPEAVLAKIFELTELHPFYMNVLCQLLWEKAALPSIESIALSWHSYVQNQRQVLSQDLIDLSLNQKHILTALAKKPTKAIQSAEFTSPLKISASSAQQAVETLVRKDLIYQTQEGLYQILDPAIRYFLNVTLWEN